MKKTILLLIVFAFSIFPNIIKAQESQDFALIYVHRLKKSTNSDKNYKVWFNDQEIGELRKIPTAFTTEARQRWLVAKKKDAGKFYLRITEGRKDIEIDKIVLDVSPGKSYYVSFNPSVAHGLKAIDELSFKDGHETFAKCDLNDVTFSHSDIIPIVKKNKYAVLSDLISLNDGNATNSKPNQNKSENNASRQTNEKNIIYIINPVLNQNNHYVAGKGEVDLRGKLTSGENIQMLLINGEELELTPDYFFEKNLVLASGINTIYLLAKDNAGTTVEKKKITIEYQTSNVAQNAAALVSTGAANYYALLIAVEDYQDPEINDLDKPIADAEKLYSSLTKSYTFEKNRVTFLKNPTRSQMIVALDDLSKKLTPDDNLLIFYAGHGYWDEKSGVGYWLPSDAMKSNTANWFRNSTLKDYIGSINSKHTILIADACFSGGIFKTRSAFTEASVGIQKLYDLPSRKAMTSGTLKEVPDESAFIHYLIKRLDENNEKFLSSEELFSSFRAAVLANSPNIPQFGEIKDVGDEGGDFIFIKRKE